MAVAPQVRQALADRLAAAVEGRFQVAGAAEDGHLVEQLAAAQGVLDEVAVGAQVRDHVGDVEIPRERTGASISDKSGIVGLVGDELRPQDRLQAVRRDHHVTLVHLAARAVGPGPSGIHALDVPAVQQLHARGGAGPQQDGVQVAAVRHHVGAAVAAPEPLAQVEVGELLAGEGVPEDQPPGEHAPLDHLVQQAPAVEHAGGVGAELQPCAHLAELGRPLQHPDRPPGPRLRERGRQPADTASNDDHLDHVPSSPPTPGPAESRAFRASGRWRERRDRGRGRAR
ncbi:hypothetical protein HD596_011467 [Nonomuraea jabiensis]|uniref:Uncharacterized protein n=1 Tax=Nonomuraea jabiensis TaxID=882448 RepID=A0A7W9GJ91_9ACTN|nr:hypothetical protein [Nonomuraea jabiensis]MBB5784711.1 hypothetical protein [Nonomuraea jabiensis]